MWLIIAFVSISWVRNGFGRYFVSESASLTSGVAERYATALFSICKEEGQLKYLQKDIEALSELQKKSDDFCFFIKSPMYKREQQELAISALAIHLKVLENTKNLLCLLARKGRIFILPDFIKEVRSLLDKERGEMNVEVVSAGLLTKAEISKLEKIVSTLQKKKARVEVQIDHSLIGGMIVKLGSRMVDTTIKSKLVKLQNKMKEVN